MFVVWLKTAVFVQDNVVTTLLLLLLLPPSSPQAVNKRPRAVAAITLKIVFLFFIVFTSANTKATHMPGLKPKIITFELYESLKLSLRLSKSDEK